MDIPENLIKDVLVRLNQLKTMYEKAAEMGQMNIIQRKALNIDTNNIQKLIDKLK